MYIISLYVFRSNCYIVYFKCISTLLSVPSYFCGMTCSKLYYTYLYLFIPRNANCLFLSYLNLCYTPHTNNSPP